VNGSVPCARRDASIVRVVADGELVVDDSPVGVVVLDSNRVGPAAQEVVLDHYAVSTEGAGEDGCVGPVGLADVDVVADDLVVVAAGDLDAVLVCALCDEVQEAVHVVVFDHHVAIRPGTLTEVMDLTATNCVVVFRDCRSAISGPSAVKFAILYDKSCLSIDMDGLTGTTNTNVAPTRSMFSITCP
jgi:hypothetical protein